MRHGLALGVLALLMELGGYCQDVRTEQTSPSNDLPEPHEVMTLGRTVEIANGQ
jgi:hypothetical protein